MWMQCYRGLQATLQLTLLGLCLVQGARQQLTRQGSVRTVQRAHNGFTAPGTVVYGCSSLTRGVVLTFDDGPAGDQTLHLLDNLQQLGVKATFFMCGANAQAQPDIVKRVAAEGHTIGAHTWSHANMTAVMSSGDMQRVRREILETEEVLFNLTGTRPVLFRPPYGAINEELRTFLSERGYTIVMWNSGNIDWYMNDMSAEALIIMSGMADAGAIVCMHDTHLSTCHGIATLVEYLRMPQPPFYVNPQGRRIITLQECVQTDESVAFLP